MDQELIYPKTDTPRRRAVGVIVKDKKVLLFHRFAHNREYFVFPGGGIEADETPEQGCLRELNEELTIVAEIKDFITKIEHKGDNGFSPSTGYYFLVEDFTGTPTLGGEEKEAESATNQYIPEWHDIYQLQDLNLLAPIEAKEIIGQYLIEKYEK